MAARLTAKRVLSRAVRVLRPLRRVPRAWILTFHEVGEHPWALEAMRFRQIVKALVSRVEVVPLDDLLSDTHHTAIRVAITFDDGYEGACEDAIPWLAAQGLPATLFVPSRLIREDAWVPPADSQLYPGAALAGWLQFSRLHATGRVAFGLHGASHRALTSLTSAERREELRECRRVLRERGLGDGHQLAYPLGAFDSDTVADLRAEGVAVGLTTRHGGVKATSDPFRLPRVDVRREYEPEDVIAAVHGDWDALGLLQRVRQHHRHD